MLLLSLSVPIIIGERRYPVQFPDYPRMDVFVLANGLRAIGSTDRCEQGIRWRHLSLSLPDRYPTWDELKQARYQFFDETVEVLQFFPPRDEYVNKHPFCFHLWARCDRFRMLPTR